MRRPKVGVSILIRHGNLVLMGQRKAGHAGGFWGPPGGHLEGGESFEACAIREVEEETGIILPKAVLWKAVNTIYQHEQKHYVVLTMLADMPTGQEAKAIEPEKCDGWYWFDWSTLPSPLLPGIEILVDSELNPMGELI